MQFRRDKNKTHNIKYILFTSQIMVIICSLCAFLIISSVYLTTKSKSDAVKDMRYSANITAINLSKYLDEMSDILFSTTYKTNIADILSSTDEIDIYRKYWNYSEICEYLSIADENCTFPFSICLYTDKTDRIFIDSVNIINESEAVNQKWYNRVLSERNKFCYLTESDGKKTYISIVNVILNINDHNESVGFIKISIDTSVIKELLKTTNISEGYITAIKNNDGKIFFTSLKETNDDEWKSVVADSNNTNCKLTNFAGRKYLLVSSPLSITDWSCIVISPYADLFKPVIVMIIILIIILLIVFGTVYMVSYRIGGNIVEPLDMLLSRMKNIKFGEMTKFEYSKTTNSEITDIINAYNTMITDVRQLIDYNAKYSELVEKYELELMQSQIKPHFLYNTLNFINWLAKTNDNTAVSELIETLSKFYRASLSNNESTAKIKDELTHIKHYVKIENFKHKDKITLNINVPEYIQEISIPKITLQPLVENAIMHGILEKEDQTGTISISAAECDGDIILTVSDDGVGISNEQINEILNGGQNGGIGITNTDKRLKMYYGEQYGLELKSDGETFTRVNIRIKTR